MNSRKKGLLLPGLRFPEFQDTAAWSVEKLEELLGMPATYGIVTAGEFQQQGIPMVRGGDIKAGKVGDGLPFVAAEIHTQYRRTILQENDVVIALVGYPGEAAVVPAQYIGANISRAVGLLRLKEARGAQFLVSFLNSPAGKRTVLKPSAGSAQIVVNLKHLNALFIPVPSPAEQTKIANCLSSLDEWIAAQTRKVDALRTQKNGLMQQLLPREGETQPCRRFPEFRDTGDWEAGNLGSKVSKVGSGITPTGGDTTYKQAGRPFVRSQNVGWGELLLEDVAFIDEEIHSSFRATEIKTLDVLLNITGASIGRSAVADQRIMGGNVNQHVCIIRVKPAELNPFFINQYLISPMGQKQIDSFQAGGNRQGLNFAQIRSFFIPLPPSISEQKRIADCLASLDDVISAATQALETLKVHKKGLMQRLFPPPEEIEA